jgi:hypothetical protein
MVIRTREEIIKDPMQDVAIIDTNAAVPTNQSRDEDIVSTPNAVIADPTALTCPTTAVTAREEGTIEYYVYT